MEFPAGQVKGKTICMNSVNQKSFLDIPFDIIDPETNKRKACLGLSAAQGYSNEALIPVKQKARSLYILHTTGKNYYAGSITIMYKDGTNFVDHIGPGKITNWWYPSESQDRKSNPVMRVAWTGKNKFSRSVGVTVYGWSLE
jgi:hypothetical protein